jgi:hypothetical protein
MALDQTVLDSDAAFIVREDIPTTITVGSDTVTGTRMSVRQARDSMAEGQRDTYAFSVYVLVSDLSSLPAIDALVTISGTDYLIVGKDTDDVQDILRLDLAEEYAPGGI